MRIIKLLVVVYTLLLAATAHAEIITVAAAADLKFAMDEIVAVFEKTHPHDKIQVIYGSSGKFRTQITQDAPYDLFFSADIAYPQELFHQGLAASAVRPYAIGRIVLWSADMDASKLTLASLADPGIKRIAIANPQHAPYGKRAEEALRSSGLWEKVRPKLVFGENIAQTAQFVQTGNAQVGILALSLALSPELSKKGGYYLIPENLHTPLEQGYIITKRGGKKPLAKEFAGFFGSQQARSVMVKYGFALPGERQAREKHVPAR